MNSREFLTNRSVETPPIFGRGFAFGSPTVVVPIILAHDFRGDAANIRSLHPGVTPQLGAPLPRTTLTAAATAITTRTFNTLG
jgi:hypothetical protein